MPRNRIFPMKNSIRQKILRRDDYLCQYCGEDAVEIDHIIPYTWCINNREDNLVASCRICNGIASNMIFNNFSEKKQYILEQRARRERRRKGIYVELPCDPDCDAPNWCYKYNVCFKTQKYS